MGLSSVSNCSGFDESNYSELEVGGQGNLLRSRDCGQSQLFLSRGNVRLSTCSATHVTTHRQGALANPNCRCTGEDVGGGEPHAEGIKGDDDMELSHSLPFHPLVKGAAFSAAWELWRLIYRLQVGDCISWHVATRFYDMSVIPRKTDRFDSPRSALGAWRKDVTLAGRLKIKEAICVSVCVCVGGCVGRVNSINEYRASLWMRMEYSIGVDVK